VLLAPDCEVGVKLAYIRMSKTVEGCFIGTISNTSFLMSRSLSNDCKQMATHITSEVSVFLFSNRA